jgi:diaminopimelate epimerase
MTTLQFTKMQGLGNDFVVIDAISQAVTLDPERVRHLADRRFGVGCDQVLVVERPRGPTAEFRYRIYNADGGEVEQCGNGARCFARFVRDRGLTDKRELRVETLGGDITLTVEADGQVRVDMGLPRLEPEAIPLRAAAQARDYPLQVDGRVYRIGAVSMGNPHAVLEVDDVERVPVAELGAKIESHPDFPRRVNAGFMQVVSRNHIRLRVFERGVGETLACGTGACAAVVVGRVWDRLDGQVAVDLPGGRLVVSWAEAGEPVYLTGPAEAVFEGKVDL